MRRISEWILSVLLLFGLPAAAQETDSAFLQAPPARDRSLTTEEFRALVGRPSSAGERTGVNRVSARGQHDLRLTLGIAPVFDDWDVVEWEDHDRSNPAYEVLHSKYYDAYFGRHCLGALSAGYTYGVTDRLELGAAVSYTRFFNALYRAGNGRLVTKHREHYLSLMPAMRWSWIRFDKFRLYSGAELGVQLGWRRGFFEDTYRTRLRAAGQLTLAGITVGRNFFFCSEFGFGCRGVLLVGLGWRIDAKSVRR